MFERQQKLIKIADKVKNLRENNSQALLYFLKLAHSDVEWLLPEGTPPHKAEKGAHGLTPSNLMREMRTMYLYLRGGNDGLAPRRREVLFQQLLERIHPTEAAMIVAAKDGKFVNAYRVPKKIVDAAFPGLLERPVSIKFLR